MTPTPWLKDEETIRLYGGFRDAQGRSRIGYLDLECSDPSSIRNVSRVPVIDLGLPGMFDDRGMILGDVVPDPNRPGRIRMYYVGFQQVENAKFYAFTGCCYSDDGGDHFERYSTTPIMDRSDDGPFINAIHSIHYLNDMWHCWYSTGDGWKEINDEQYPIYRIRYTTSSDGLTFPASGQLCIDVSGNEYRIGRPRVTLHDDDTTEYRYSMYFTSDNIQKQYRSGAAVSTDGIDWKRDQRPLDGFKQASGTWDRQMACYPTRISTRYGNYLFYSGNNMGMDGVGFAQWSPDN